MAINVPLPPFLLLQGYELCTAPGTVQHKKFILNMHSYTSHSLYEGPDTHN